MAKKADFTEDEWKLLISTPRYILLALRSADRMGLLTSRGERKALDSYIEEYKTRSPLVRSILSDQKDVSNRLRTKKPLEYIERTGKLLNNKAKGSSGQSARAFLLGSSVAIANGVRENRRRNADSITDNEQEMLDKIKEALKSTAVKRPKKPKATRTTKRATVQKSAEKPKTTTRTPRATSRGGTSTRPRTTSTRKSPAKSTTRATSTSGPKRPTRSSKIVKPAPTRSQSAGTIRRESPMTPKPAPTPRQAAPAPAPRQPAPAPRQPAPAPRQPAPAPQKPTLPPPAQTYTSPPAASGAPSVVRWTNIYAAPQPNTALEAGLAPGAQVSVLGRDQWGGWVLIEQGNSTGWIPRDALDLESADGLTIMDSGAPQATGSVAQATAPQAAQAAPVVEDYSAEPEVVETMTITRWTNIFSQPNAGAATDVSLAPDTRIVLLGAGDGWINIRHEETEGWIPNDALM